MQKNLFEKKIAVYNDKIPDRQYQKFADEIIDAYNNTVHSTIKNTPNNVFQDIDKKKHLVFQPQT
mgnify:CR=1 FL=1